MAWKRNLLGHDKGSWRSLGGAADEQAFLGKATGAGFYVFFKVWRDMPYDAVLDYKGQLFRVEVKGASGGRFILTRGSRSGSQISRATASRQRPITLEDCDFTACIYSGGTTSDSTCYILPTEIIEILSRRATAGGFGLSRGYLGRYFEEKWDLLTGGKLNLTTDEIKMGFVNVDPSVRRDYLERLGVVFPVPSTYTVPSTRTTLTSRTDIEVLLIWQNLGA